jgi:hypothetical protein
VLGHAPRAHDVVRDHAVAAAVLGVHFLDQLAQQRRAHRVKPRVGLVEEHDLGVQHQRARKARALAHAARQLVGHLLPLAAQTDLAHAPVDYLGDLLLALLGVLAQREGDVVIQRKRAEQRAVLKQHAELLAHLKQLGVAESRHRLAVHDHIALVRVQQADDVLDAHGLAGARRADDHRDLALWQSHVQAAQHVVASKGLMHLHELHRVGSVCRSDRPRVVAELVRAVAALRALLLDRHR